ncbi:MAG TPA: ComEA family DNA-binding protein [Anaerolineales bacterium]|nr:ComEA family DNA-binding protein [Anaerolineae bacterium]HIP87382.1 ComEA family DNA-binding protein [Anaerolineales bacterium]
MKQRRSLLFLCSVVSLIAGGVIGFFTPHPQRTPITVITPDPTTTPLPTPTPLPLRVYVCGAVREPGVYRLPPGSLVEDAVRAAGGPTEEADLVHINLARELLDQQQVYVPYLGEENSYPTLSDGVAPTATPQRIDLNTATAAELEALPHIGPTLARDIVAYRETYGPFRSVEDLLNVPGIGPSTLKEIRPWVEVGK